MIIDKCVSGYEILGLPGGLSADASFPHDY